MGDAEPLVSVIIPTFNRQAYLREAVASVFAQTYAAWELIVADDGSTDGTRDYLASLRDPRVRAVECAHSGFPGRVRNAGIAHAKGRFVAFLDDDDLWMPEKLALQIADLAAHPERHWSYAKCDRIDAQGAAVAPPPGRRWQPYAGWILEPVVRRDAWVAMPALVVERTALNVVGGFDPALQLCEDYDLYLKLARRWQASVVDRPLAVIRAHHSNTASGRIEAAEQMMELYGALIAGPDASVHRAARLQYAQLAVDLAERHRFDGASGRAFRALGRAFLRRPGYPRMWLALLKACVQPLLPPPAMRVYRRLRRP